MLRYLWSKKKNPFVREMDMNPIIDGIVLLKDMTMLMEIKCPTFLLQIKIEPSYFPFQYLISYGVKSILYV